MFTNTYTKTEQFEPMTNSQQLTVSSKRVNKVLKKGTMDYSMQLFNEHQSKINNQDQEENI